MTLNGHDVYAFSLFNCSVVTPNKAMKRTLDFALPSLPRRSVEFKRRLSRR